MTVEPSKPDFPASFSREGERILFPSPIESIGLTKTKEQLEKLPGKRKPLFIRIGKLENVEESRALIQALFSYGDAFILEESFDKKTLLALRGILQSKALLLSLHHDEVIQEISHIKELVGQQLIDGIVIEEREHGDAANQTTELLAAINTLRAHGLKTFPTIISGGVVEPQDALLFMENGADLVLLSVGYVLSGPGLPKRINEALLDEEQVKPIEYLGWKSYWYFGLIMLISGIIALLFSMTRVILPYDEAFLQLTREQLMALNPNIIKFMAHDRMTLAGTMVSGGILYMQLAKHGVKFGIHWARKAINIAGVTGFLGILLYLGYGYFDWLHGLLWLVLLPFFYFGWKKTKGAQSTSVSRNRTNHPAWKKGVWGQLCFVVLGFSFVLGGVIISIIGATGVFVSTDIGYICMTPEQLNEITDKLIPVIAHDRAGFGSALISVGLLVLMISLWGFHQGAKWVWRTYLIAGSPAFAAGILTHFIIGYTTFIHLLPAYVALALFLLGLILSKGFFYKAKRI